MQIGFVGLFGLDHISVTLKKGPIDALYVREVRIPVWAPLLYLGNAVVPVTIRGVRVTLKDKKRDGKQT